MIKNDTEHFKIKLETEKKLIEEELKTVGRKNSESAGGWQATPAHIDVDSADENEVAEKIEEFEDNSSILEQLEKQLSEINSALKEIETGSFGMCTVCKKPIETSRLEANPSAKTCKAHMHPQNS
jgi:RNA polymerase-binding transcription factor DksA